MDDARAACEDGEYGAACSPLGEKTSHVRWPAHRLSYILATGEDPGGKAVHHLCEDKSCIYPDHLEAIDQTAHFNGHRKPEWYTRKPRPTPVQIVEIRRRAAAGEKNADIA